MNHNTAMGGIAGFKFGSCLSFCARLSPPIMHASPLFCWFTTVHPHHTCISMPNRLCSWSAWARSADGGAVASLRASQATGAQLRSCARSHSALSEESVGHYLSTWTTHSVWLSCMQLTSLVFNGDAPQRLRDGNSTHGCIMTV